MNGSQKNGRYPTGESKALQDFNLMVYNWTEFNGDKNLSASGLNILPRMNSALKLYSNIYATELASTTESLLESKAIHPWTTPKPLPTKQIIVQRVYHQDYNPDHGRYCISV